MRSLAIVLLSTLASATLAQNDPASWPMYQHDSQHSGRNDFVEVLPQHEIGWTADCYPYFSSPVIVSSDDGCVLACSSYALQCFWESGLLRWRYEDIGIGYASIVLPNGLLAMPGSGFTDVFSPTGTRLGRMKGIDGLRAAVLEDSSIAEAGEFLKFPDGYSYHDTTGLYTNVVAARDGYVYALAGEKTGKLTVAKMTPTSIIYGPELPYGAAGSLLICGPGDRLYFVASKPQSGYRLVCADLTGNKLWESNVVVPDSFAVARDGTVYAKTGTHLIAIGPTGELAWDLTVSFNGGDQWPPIVDSSGRVFLINTNDPLGGSAILCDSPNGFFEWSQRIAPFWDYPIATAMCLSPSGLLVGCADGFLYSLKTKTHKRTVKLSVELNGIAPEATPPQLEYDLRLPGSDAAFYWHKVSPNADGTYDLLLPNGTFDVGFKPQGWLSRLVANIDDNTTQIQSLCQGGDVNNDDTVDIQDLNAVMINFGGTGADTNLDGTTDLLDLNRVFIDFGLVGEW